MFSKIFKSQYGLKEQWPRKKKALVICTAPINLFINAACAVSRLKRRPIINRPQSRTLSRDTVRDSAVAVTFSIIVSLASIIRELVNKSRFF